MSKPASRGGSAPDASVDVPPVVPALLNDIVFRELVPAPPRRGRIGATGGFVVAGVMDFRDAAERGIEVHVEPVGEPDEDPAVVQMYAANDLLPTTKNELAMGRVYLVTERTIKNLAKKNTRNDNEVHMAKYGERRSERLNAMWGEVFGVSKTNLRRYARALGAPAEVRRLFLAGHVRLIDVLKVVDAGPEVARGVGLDLLTGGTVRDVLERRLVDGPAANEKSEKPPVNGETVVGFVKSLNRWARLINLEGRKPRVLTREQDRALQRAGELIACLRQKSG